MPKWYIWNPVAKFDIDPLRWKKLFNLAMFAILLSCSFFFLISALQVVKNKWYLRKHLVTAHGAPLKRAKGSNGEPKTQEANANGKVQDASKALPKSENIFEFSECQPNGPLGRKPADPHEKHMERQNEEDINEELDVDN